MINKWFKVELLNNFLGFKKGDIVFAKKHHDKFKIFDGKDMTYNQSFVVSLNEMIYNFKSIRVDNKIVYLNNDEQVNLNTLEKTLSNRLFY